MTFQELEDYMAIVKVEQSLGGKDVSNKEILFYYANMEVCKLNSFHAAHNTYEDKEVLVIS